MSFIVLLQYPQSMSSKVELDKFIDGDLKLVVNFAKGSNFWMRNDGTCSWVPKKSEVELIKEGLYAVDTYNVRKRKSEAKEVEV